MNSGVMLFRKSKWSMEFLEEVAKLGRIPEPKLEKASFIFPENISQKLLTKIRNSNSLARKSTFSHRWFRRITVTTTFGIITKSAMTSQPYLLLSCAYGSANANIICNDFQIFESIWSFWSVLLLIMLKAVSGLIFWVESRLYPCIVSLEQFSNFCAKG